MEAMLTQRKDKVVGTKMFDMQVRSWGCNLPRLFETKSSFAVQDDLIVSNLRYEAARKYMDVYKKMMNGEDPNKSPSAASQNMSHFEEDAPDSPGAGLGNAIFHARPCVRITCSTTKYSGMEREDLERLDLDESRRAFDGNDKLMRQMISSCAQIMKDKLIPILQVCLHAPA